MNTKNDPCVDGTAGTHTNGNAPNVGTHCTLWPTKGGYTYSRPKLGKPAKESSGKLDNEFSCRSLVEYTPAWEYECQVLEKRDGDACAGHAVE